MFLRKQRKINPKDGDYREREKNVIKRHTEGNQRLKTFKMRRDLVTLKDTRRGSRLSSGN